MKFTRRSFLIMTTAALAACKPGQEILKFSGDTMGTRYNVVAVSSGQKLDRDALQGAIDALAR